MHAFISYFSYFCISIMHELRNNALKICYKIMKCEFLTKVNGFGK